MQKVSISFYSLPQKMAKSANKHLHAKCVKYSYFYNIFTMVWPILMKFCMAKHIHLPRLWSIQKFENFKIQVGRWWPTRKLRKISISFNSVPQNGEKSANNHFHAKLVKFSNFFDMFADVLQILIKFCMTTHISTVVQKVKFKKKLRWWTLAFKNLINTISEQLSVWFW